jgi:fused signal recognition particle receptor
MLGAPSVAMRAPTPVAAFAAPAAAAAAPPSAACAWVCGRPCSGGGGEAAAAPPRRRALRGGRVVPVAAVFDFVRKAGDYVKERAARDLRTVEKFNDGLAKSRDRLARDLATVLGGGVGVDGLEGVLDELGDVLIMADMGVEVVEKVVEDLRVAARKGSVSAGKDVRALLKESLVRVLEEGNGGTGAVELARVEGGTTVVMVLGANGMGKTTTIGKLATRLQREGRSVLVAAADTFRAGAVDQLAEWVARAGVDFIGPKPGSKAPSSVVFDALEKAAARKASEAGAYDYVIVDTSGRLHNNVALMGELQKMVRVVRKFDADAPHEMLLVVDASIGRNAVAQAETWQREVGVTGLAVTKLDGTARAGFVVSVVNELGIPVKFIGVGETVDDLRDFDAELFVNGLVGE